MKKSALYLSCGKLSKKSLTIPFKNVERGSELCLANALQFCSDAKVLAKSSSFEHALGLCIFAIEELGKAIMLKQKAIQAKKKNEDALTFKSLKDVESFYRVPIGCLKNVGLEGCISNPFYNHKSKLYFAKSTLNFAANKRILEIMEKFGFKEIQEAKLLSPEYLSIIEKTEIRERAFYVDFDEKKCEWVSNSLNTTQEKVMEIISDIINAIEDTKKWKWS